MDVVADERAPRRVAVAAVDTREPVALKHHHARPFVPRVGVDPVARHPVPRHEDVLGTTRTFAGHTTSQARLTGHRRSQRQG